MEKNNKNLGKDELQRVLLMMKYDSKKTLTENQKNIKPSLNEDSGTAAVSGGVGGAVAGTTAAALGAGTLAGGSAGTVAMAVGSALPGVAAGTGAALAVGSAVIGGLAGLALVPLAYWLITKDNGSKRVQKYIQFCSSNADKVAKLERKLDDSTIRNIADKIYDAINGVGTDEESLFDAFKQVSEGTASDVCNLVNYYNTEYRDLWDDLDSDIDSESEWTQIYRPIRNCVEDSLLKLKDKTPIPNLEEKKKKISKYKACTGFPLNLYCVNSEIGKVQKCLGLKQDNALGPKTQQALKDEGIELPLTADGVKKACSPEQLTPKLTTIPTKQTSEPELKENYKVIKKKIRENLIETKENKKNLIVEESIIKNRFSVIVENRQLKTKKEKEKFYFDVLVEMKRLNDQGFKSKLITESFFDIISGFFGKGGTGILQTIKEYFGNWLIGKLGVDTKGWIGGTIVRAIGNLDIADIPKLTNCTFTTKLLSKSLAENAVSKLQTAAGLEGTLSNIMRNTLVETLEENSTFMVKIEEALGSVLCPLISNVSGKLEDAASAMKEKAIAK